MLIHNFVTNKNFVRFKYYGDFETMKCIVADCIEDMLYIGNSTVDASPIFIYVFDNNMNVELLKDFKQLNTHLRELRIRNCIKKDLTKKEKSLLTFFNFFMNCDENRLIKGVGSFEIKRFIESDEVNY